MPYQNRVNPYGDLIATPERMGWTGNRGVLINDQRQLRRPWQLQRWIVCALAYKGWHRQVWTPRRWTELFFLDEATAFAAGHRPCHECRRPAARAFRAAWEAAHGPVATLVELDRHLHQARLARPRPQVHLAHLPAGAMVSYRDQPHLWWRQQLYPWTFAGYQPPLAQAPPAPLELLTPEPTVGALQAGYVCQVAVTSGSA